MNFLICARQGNEQGQLGAGQGQTRAGQEQTRTRQGRSF